VKNLDREVLAYLAEDVLLFLLYDLAGPVMGIDDVVTDLELDVLGLDDDLQVLDLLDLLDLGCLRDGVLLGVKRRSGCRTSGFMSAGSDPRG
jgi:hypothetical protein